MTHKKGIDMETKVDSAIQMPLGTLMATDKKASMGRIPTNFEDLITGLHMMMMRVIEGKHDWVI